MTDITYLPLTSLEPNPRNPRTDVGDVTELAASMTTQGIVQPLLVTPATEPDVYLVVAGHRRLAAAAKAGMGTVPCIVEDLTTADQVAIMLVENLQRTDLTLIEEAQGYQQMLDLGYKAGDIALQTGRPRKTVEQTVKMLSLPAEAQERITPVMLEDIATFEEFDGDEYATTVMTQALGRRSFAWQVEQLRQRRETLEGNAGRLAELAAAGVKTVKDPDDFGMVPHGFQRRYDLNDKTPVEDLPIDAAITVATRSGRITYYQPTRKADPAQPAKPDPAAEAAQAAADAKREKDKTDAITSGRLRRQFLTDLMTTKFPTSDKNTILAYAKGCLLNGYGLPPVSGASIASRSPHHVLLWSIAHIDPNEDVRAWELTGAGREKYVDQFQLLIDLGYVPSEAEATQLAAGRAAQDAEGD